MELNELRDVAGHVDRKTHTLQESIPLMEVASNCDRKLIDHFRSFMAEQCLAEDALRHQVSGLGAEL